MTTTVKPDPTRPVKAVAAFVFLLLGTLWAQLQGIENWGSLGVQDWLTIIIPTVLGTGAVYGLANPAVRAAGPAYPDRPNGDNQFND